MKNEFYAVTMTSVYHVLYDDEPARHLEVTKIISKRESDLPVGYQLTGGYMLSIGKYLIMYVPEGGGITSFERRVEMVNTRYWGDKTSSVVGYFFSKEEALKCSECSDAQPCDPKWHKQSKDVLESIPKNHPVFEVCYYPDLAFM